MATVSPPSFWQTPAWRDPSEWVGVNKQIRRLGREVETLLRQVNADVLAFYLACDPFVPNHLSCLAAPGAEYPNACSYLHQPLDGTEPVAFFPDALSDPMRSVLNEDRVAKVGQLRSDSLFADFLLREGIQSRGRFVIRDSESGRIVALLTVNFRRAVSRIEWERNVQSLRTKFTQIVMNNAADIRRKLQKKSRYLLPAFLGMLDILDPLARQGAVGGIRELMERVLADAIPPMDAPDRRWCGTVHRLTPEGRSLELIASAGEFEMPARTAHALDRGEGVISWVALRQQAVRIKNLPTSEFRHMSVKYLDGAQSQLAIPILVRGDLWGTLSLEASDPNVFRRQEVGYLTRVASLAAMAAMRWEFEYVAEERSLYLDAVYAAKRANRPPEPLPTLEELKRTSTGPVNFNLEP